MLRVSHLSGFNANRQLGALALLRGETQGFAIDATYNVAALYTGGPANGSVAVIDTGTPANNLSNVALQSSNLTQSGTSAKQVVWDSIPYVRWTPHNLALQSQTINNASWNKSNVTISADAVASPDGTTTADTVSSALAGSNRLINQAVTTVVGFVYTVSVYAKAGVTDWINLQFTDFVANGCSLYFDLTNGALGTAGTAGSGVTVLNSGIENAGNGWWRCWLAAAASTTSMRIAWSMAEADLDESIQAGDTYHAWGAQVNRGYSPTPYLVTTTAARIGIPQEYDTAASKFGILVEPAATNLLLQSEDYTTGSWQTLSARDTITANNTTSPDGSSTADKIEAASSNAGGAFVGQSYTTTSGQAYTNTIFAKKGAGSDYFLLQITDNGAKFVNVWFNLNTGAVGSSTNGTWTVGSSSITSVGDGWYRCQVTTTVDVVTTYTYLVVCDADNSAAVTIGAYFYAWGAQAELGTVATSYIPTLGATVTRAADNINALSSSFPYGSANTAYISAKTRLVTAQHDVLEFDANNANEDESVKLYTNATADILMQIEDGAATQLAPLDSAVNASANTTFQVTGAWDTNDVDVSANGTAAASDGTATMPTITHARLGCNPTPGNHLNGYIYKMVVVPRQIETATGDIENWRYA